MKNKGKPVKKKPQGSGTKAKMVSGLGIPLPASKKLLGYK
jgi:hypothetical protein